MWLQEKNGKTYADKQVKMDLRGAVLSYQAAMRFSNSYATTPYICRVCGCASAAPDAHVLCLRREKTKRKLQVAIGKARAKGG